MDKNEEDKDLHYKTYETPKKSKPKLLSEYDGDEERELTDEEVKIKELMN